MTSVRFVLALAGSSLALAQAQAVLAQDGPAPAPAAASAAVSDQSDENPIIVTGTRVVGRTKLDTASPVDVLSGAALRQQGTTELSQALAAVAPSVDFPRPSATDGTDAIRPITLRGLSPDETLVLINGVRAHTAALLNINSSVGRGRGRGRSQHHPNRRARDDRSAARRRVSAIWFGRDRGRR